ncbi:MAG: ATP-dependent zinc metalloprotease FtsH [Actinomycetota bacterium]|nr:ATP-dependent zinc metalloprotease FtsH [Actinomycetota bacterium]MDD5666318.1 ATP-dependent zinc metalloprotease FtsH [Actinomycetota bacterium]
MGNKRLWRTAIFYLIIVFVVVLVWTKSPSIFGNDKTKDLSWFEDRLAAGEIADVTVKDKDNILQGTLVSGEEYEVSYPAEYAGDLVTKINEYRELADSPDPETAQKYAAYKDLELKVDSQGGFDFLGIVLNLLPFLLIVVLFFFLFQQMQGGGSKVMSFGKSRAKVMNKEQVRVTFKDVAGVDEAVEELEEIRDFLASPAKFQALGAKIPKGVLLYGPPGSGKTLLARAVAGEAGVPFFSISGSDFVEMFVGVGASRVRDLFEQAKASAPAIIFMDEIDAVGRHRGAGLGGGHDEREQTLNQLLVEMDGFDVKTGVILVAATNRPDILDPALLRPGRFDRQIVVDRPDLNGRRDILKVHTRDKPLADDVDLEVLARRTPGFTGADLANLVNEAALLSARHSKKKLDMEEMEESIDRVIAGPERRTRLISDKEKEIIAYHEAGHALVAHTLPNADPVHKISIIPRGQALGYTLTLPMEDKYLVTKGELVDELAMLLGGRVAEEMIFDEITTGDQNDIEKATKLARKMVCEFGMSEKLGPLTLGQKQGEVFLGRDFTTHKDYSDQIAYEIDKEVRRLVDEAYERAAVILKENRDKLDSIARTLIEKETLEKEELLALLEGREISAPSGRELAAEDGQSPEREQEEVRAPSPIKGSPLPQPE